MPYQAFIRKSGIPCSRIVGTCGNADRRSAVVIAAGRTRPVVHNPWAELTSVKIMSTSPDARAVMAAAVVLYGTSSSLMWALAWKYSQAMRKLVDVVAQV